MHWKIANLAIETGISPTELMNLDPRMLWTIERALIARSQNMSKAKQIRKR